MRVLLSVYGSCGAAEPVVGDALPVRALGTELRVCAPSSVAAATSDRS
ncbi:hypothetical protein ABT387_33600 [Streptomyces lydicus]